jgi:hypothetical protein
VPLRTIKTIAECKISKELEKSSHKYINSDETLQFVQSIDLENRGDEKKYWRKAGVQSMLDKYSRSE